MFLNESHKKDMIEIAREVEAGFPIDWDSLGLHPNAVYDLMANKIIDNMNKTVKEFEENDLTKDDFVFLLVSTILHNTVYMFVDELKRSRLADDNK